MDTYQFTLKKEEAITRLNGLINAMIRERLDHGSGGVTRDLTDSVMLSEAITSNQNLIELLKFCDAEQVCFHFLNTYATSAREDDSLNNIPNIVLPGAALSVNSRGETAWEIFEGIA